VGRAWVAVFRWACGAVFRRACGAVFRWACVTVLVEATEIGVDIFYYVFCWRSTDSVFVCDSKR